MQCNDMQCNDMQCNNMQCNNMTCNEMTCNEMKCRAMKLNDMHVIECHCYWRSWRPILDDFMPTEDLGDQFLLILCFMPTNSLAIG